MSVSISYPNLPITSSLEKIYKYMVESSSRSLVLTAETGAGKSTIVPLFLAGKVQGKILILEPRRIAAIAVASRMADLLGEKTGQTSGYLVKNDICTGPDTRIFSMTEAILGRYIIEDPSLPGISAVVLDEFHERSIHSDFAAALLREVKILRPDLYILVMSAAFETEKVCSFFDAPLLHVPGRLWPVHISYLPPYAGERLENTVRRAVFGVMVTGDILVFLPGLAEIRRAAAVLQDYDAEILILHSSITLDEQRYVLEKHSGRRRVILSSAIAETSLTVSGVTVVIDSGLSRITRFQNRTGMDRLVTESENQFSALQRAGRAGRIEEGYCIRLWAEHDARPRSIPSEILRSDLSSLVLDCALWLRADRSVLDWLDEPPETAWLQGFDLLKQLGAVDEKGLTTAKGRHMSRLGVHPRVAAVLLSLSVGTSSADSYFSFEDVSVIAAIAGDQGKQRGCVSELLLLYRRGGGDAAWRHRITNAAADLRKRGVSCLDVSGRFSGSTGGFLLNGYPDRIARLKKGFPGVYQFSSGRTAVISDDNADALVLTDYIVAVSADSGEREGRIYVYEPLGEQFAEKWLFSRSSIKVQLFWENDTLKKVRRTVYGELALKEVFEVPSSEDGRAAYIAKIKEKGSEALPWNVKSRTFMARLLFLYRFCADKLPDTKEKKRLSSVDAGIFFTANREIEDFFLQDAEEWLAPFIGKRQDENCSSLSEAGLLDALKNYAGWNIVQKMESLVPESIPLPSGSCRGLDYTAGDIPVLAVKIQELFGLEKTPQICGIPVMLHLLSPAGRPVQITQDLAGFWKSTWPQVVRELKGRYPKHLWPDNPLTAEPAWKTKRKR